VLAGECVDLRCQLATLGSGRGGLDEPSDHREHLVLLAAVMELEVGSQLVVATLHVSQFGVLIAVHRGDLVDQCSDPRELGPQVAVVDGGDGKFAPSIRSDVFMCRLLLVLLDLFVMRRTAKSHQDVGDGRLRVLPVDRRKHTAMATGHRKREQDGLVAGIAGTLEPVDQVDGHVRGRGPAPTAVAAQTGVVDRDLLDPPGSLQLAHPVTERVHRSGHGST
jgi:hypothetical protein